MKIYQIGIHIILQKKGYNVSVVDILPNIGSKMHCIAFKQKI